MILGFILLLSDKAWYRFALLVISIITYFFPTIASIIPGSIFAGVYNWYKIVFLTNNTVVIRGCYFLIGFCLIDFKILQHYRNPIVYLLSTFTFIFASNFTPIVITRIVCLMASVSIFQFAVNYCVRYSDEKSVEFRKMSIIFYFTHIPVKFAMQLIVSRFTSGYETGIWLMTILVLFVWSNIVMKTETGRKIGKFLYF